MHTHTHTQTVPFYSLDCWSRRYKKKRLVWKAFIQVDHELIFSYFWQVCWQDQVKNNDHDQQVSHIKWSCLCPCMFGLQPKNLYHHDLSKKISLKIKWVWDYYFFMTVWDFVLNPAPCNCYKVSRLSHQGLWSPIQFAKGQNYIFCITENTRSIWHNTRI